MVYIKIKRVVDLIISLISLVILFPMFVIVSIAIKVDSKGPIFFKQKRLTKDGNIFEMYKFRSMCENAEFMGTGLFNFEGDDRVTRVGHFIRRTSIDELPNLINVLKGEMALVGPRPAVTYELGNYEELSSEYKNRFSVLPGITGLAQVRGRNELPWNKKIKFDNKYIKLLYKYGPLVDLHILALTVKNVFSMKDIYEEKDESIAAETDEEIRKRASEIVISKARKGEMEDENKY